MFPPFRAGGSTVHQKLHSVLYFLYSINNMTFLTCSSLPPDVRLSRSFLDLFGFAPSDGGPKIWFKEESFVHMFPGPSP